MAESVKVNKILLPKSDSVPVRAGAGNSSKVVGTLRKTGLYRATKKQGNWYYIPELQGWVNQKFCTVTSSNLGKDTKTVSVEANAAAASGATTANAAAASAAASGAAQTEKAKIFASSKQEAIFEEYLNSEYGGSYNTDDLLVNSLNGVYGIPYQFPESVDRKMDKTAFGGIYAERIISRMPLLMMSPGKVSFMKSYSDGEKSAVLDALAGADNSGSTSIGDFLSKPGRYYSFDYDAATYWEYVDTMNHSCAAYLGIEDVKVSVNGGDEVMLSEIKWKNATNKKFDSLLLSQKNYVCFYTDAETTKNESFSNSTAESQLYSAINSGSDYARELRFILGTQSGIDLMDSSALQGALDGMNNIVNKLTDGKSLIDSLKSEFVTIATGGKLMFPQIWSDSEFDQSFDVKLKLRCPCPNKVSWFFDIIVPLNHIIALTLPRIPTADMVYGNNTTATRTDSFANGYMTPFLVRAFYKGLFNCDMGIITSLNISKGKEGSWTLDGLPTEVDVDFTIKDLYSQMAMSMESQGKDFLANTTFLNYMANACGISINKPDIERSITLWSMSHANTWKKKLTAYTWRQQTAQKIQNKILDLYTGVFNY